MPRPKLRVVPLLNTFDLSKGRITLPSGFFIDDISGLITEETLQPFLRKLSQEDLENMLAWNLCVIHEFESDLTLGREELTSDLLMRFLVAMLRWISPTQTTDTLFAQGFVDKGKPLKFQLSSTKPCTTITVPQFAVRPQTIFLEDCEARIGRAVPEGFSVARPFFPMIERIVADVINGSNAFVPIVVAVRLSEQAYLDFDPQLRLMKRVMALEALFSTGDTYGKRALVSRVPEFLGERTLIYPTTRAPYSVGGIISDICELRNAFAHGDTVPAKFLSTSPEPSVASVNVRSYADVLREASAVILRRCLLKIFTDHLVEAFSDKVEMERLF
jgi:hypothetical protein